MTRRRWLVFLLVSVAVIAGAALVGALIAGDEEERVSTFTPRETFAPFTFRTTSTTTTTLPIVGTRQRPIPLGAPAEPLSLPSWMITVVSVDQNAWPEVQAENQFNTPPPAGITYVMASVKLTYQGPGEDSPMSVDLGAVGDSQVIYTPTQNTCGVVPDNYQRGNRLLSGGSVTGNVCWAVTTSDVSSLLLLARPLFGSAGGAFFSLS